MSPRAHAAMPLALAAAMLLLCVAVLAQRPLPRAQLAASEPIQLRIDPNTADNDTLCLLPRVGPGIAQRIIHHRNTRGPFQTPNDITRVNMIGPKTINAFQPWIKLDPPQ